MMALKIAVVGAGGVGGYLAAKLLQHNCDVTLVVKEVYFDAIKKNGLEIIEYKKDTFKVYPSLEKTLTSVYDVVFIATKSCDYKSVSEVIKNGVDENTLVITLCDGLGIESLLESHLPSVSISNGLIHIISELQSPSVIKRKSFTFYLQITSSEENKNLKKLEQLLNDCELRTTSFKNLQYEKWKKYLFSASMSMLTTYFNKPIGYIINEKLELIIDVLLEIQKVATAKDINITNQDIEKTIKQISYVQYEVKTIMQIDFENNAKSEFNSLVSYIVKEAQFLNISIPQIENIHAVLKEKYLSNNQS